MKGFDKEVLEAFTRGAKFSNNTEVRPNVDQLTIYDNTQDNEDKFSALGEGHSSVKIPREMLEALLRDGVAMGYTDGEYTAWFTVDDI